MANELLDVLNRAKREEQKPLYVTEQGFKVYTFEQANIIAQKILLERKSDMPVVELGVRELQENGMGYKQSNVPWVAIDPSSAFLNRFKFVSTKRGQGIEEEWRLVTDYRAIRDQKKGRIYASSVTAYVIKRDKDTKKPVVKETIEVLADEFIKEYDKEMPMQSMINVSEAIKEYEATGIKAVEVFA